MIPVCAGVLVIGLFLAFLFWAACRRGAEADAQADALLEKLERGEFVAPLFSSRITDTIPNVLNHVVAISSHSVPVNTSSTYDRREPVAVMQLALDGLHQAFGRLPTPLVGLRDLGWEVVARSAWIRRRMIAHAVS